MVLLALILGAATAIAVALTIAYREVRPSDRVTWTGTDIRSHPAPWGEGRWHLRVTGRAPVVRKHFAFHFASYGFVNPRTPNPGASASSNVPRDEAARFRRFASDDASVAALQRHEFLLGGSDASFVHFTVTKFGWPWPCMAKERAFTQADSTKAQVAHQTQVLLTTFGGSYTPVPPDPSNMLAQAYFTATFAGRELPLRPLLVPLIANTAVYGAAWFVLVTLFAALRRVLIPRAFCKHCRYTLAGLSAGTPCPECGSVSAR